MKYLAKQNFKNSGVYYKKDEIIHKALANAEFLMKMNFIEPMPMEGGEEPLPVLEDPSEDDLGEVLPSHEDEKPKKSKKKKGA